MFIFNITNFNKISYNDILTIIILKKWFFKTKISEGKSYYMLIIYFYTDKALFVIETDVAENILEDGKKHWIIPKWSYKYELKEKSNIIFENLFNGNEVLSECELNHKD